jgi:addiction module HigA family antidote
VTTHPGEVLGEEFLKPLGMSANALALALRVPATRIGAIVKGERSVTADTALRLARCASAGGLIARLVPGIEISKAGYFSVKLQIDRSGRSVPLLANNDLSLSENGFHISLPFLVLDRPGTRFLVHEIVLFTIDEHHHVGILLNRTRLAQIRQLWMFVFAAFDLPR